LHTSTQEHALYYAAFATYLEARGAYARADSIYQQGVNRLAAPVDRLRGRYREFQERMVGSAWESCLFLSIEHLCSVFRPPAGKCSP
jgi:hypothetical protein